MKREPDMYRRVKRNGKWRYVAAGHDHGSMPIGAGMYWVTVEKGSKLMTWEKVEPKDKALAAAIDRFQHCLVHELMEQMKARPRVIALTPAQQQAYLAWERAVGAQRCGLTGKSLYDAVTAAVQKVHEFVEKCDYTPQRATAVDKRYKRLEQLGVWVYTCPEKDWPSLVKSDQLTQCLEKAGLSREKFSELFGVQTCPVDGMYPWDVEAVLERMMSGKKTGSQLNWD